METMTIWADMTRWGSSEFKMVGGLTRARGLPWGLGLVWAPSLKAFLWAEPYPAAPASSESGSTVLILLCSWILWLSPREGTKSILTLRKCLSDANCIISYHKPTDYHILCAYFWPSKWGRQRQPSFSVCYSLVCSFFSYYFYPLYMYVHSFWGISYFKI